MRVLTFLHSFELGGVERIALRLVRRWRELGIDAPLFMGRRDGAMAHDVGADLPIVTPSRTGIGVAHWETLWMVLTLPHTIRSLRPDILFCAGNTYAVVCVILKLTLGSACPPIVAKVSNDLERRDTPWAFRLLYRQWLRIQGRLIDHFVAMEVSMVHEIAEGMRVPSSRITVIPDPALSKGLISRLRDYGPPGQLPHKGRRFVTIARLAPQKNIAMMIRAFERGSAPDDRLTIFGDGRERVALTALVATSLIADRIEFRGYVAEPASILPMFDVFLLSSDYEGVPAAILEALAANIPIVATDCSRSMATLLLQGALGVLVDVGDEAGFAAAISAVRPGGQDHSLSLAQAERFTIEHAAEFYLDTMRSVLEETGVKQKATAIQSATVALAVTG